VPKLLKASAAMSSKQTEGIAAQLPGEAFASLDERARSVARHLTARKPIARNVAKELEAHPSLGQRAADRVATFGGSWPFVGLFVAAVVVWVAINGSLMLRNGEAFDPYPYILLNLFLSMLAAIQAPVILMSQNRQAQKDRVSAAHDYEVNLKAELEIMLLHEKLDALRQTQWGELLAIQREQLELLARLTAEPAPASTGVQQR
jgi:uncharacterized membrane protein